MDKLSRCYFCGCVKRTVRRLRGQSFDKLELVSYRDASSVQPSRDAAGDGICNFDPSQSRRESFERRAAR